MKPMTRVGIIRKYAGKKAKPTAQELSEAYDYLNYCYCCGKEFTLWDRMTFNVSHSFMGNSHRRSCG